jgi:2-haloalkanoic acid dehalogenase type II
MPGFHLILFDLDDTLFDFSACWEKGMRQTIASHPLTAGLEPDAVYEALRRHSDALWADIREKRINFDQLRRLRLSRTLAEFGRRAEADRLDDFQERYAAACMDAVVPDRAVQSLLMRLKERYTLAIVTNGPADMAVEKIERLGLAPLFPVERVFVSEQIGWHKPDPRIFAAVLERLGASPAEALFVGDNWTADIAGAMDAGLSAVWLNPAGVPPATDHKPLAVIKRLEELWEIVA